MLEDYPQRSLSYGAASAAPLTSLLVVCPPDWPGKKLFGDDSHFMHYRFVDQGPKDGLSAWWSVGGNGMRLRCAEVTSSSRGLAGGFSQQSLNRLFAQLLVEFSISSVVVVGIHGCTVDLVRVADLMGVPAAFVFDRSGLESIDSLDPDSGDATWVADAITRATAMAWMDDQAAPSDRAMDWIEVDQLGEVLAIAGSRGFSNRGFDYSRYEFCLRDHPLLMQMQAPDVGHFKDCERVLDLGCGAGIFIELLRRAGVDAEGVERSEAIADYGRGMGLRIETGDALAYLERAGQRYDGIYCSHFIEHLDFEQVHTLLQRITASLRPGGVAVLAFPDPESIRSQLLGFWRDPEHVRFYHPELVITVAASLGLVCEWRSYDNQPHRVVPFSPAPPAMPEEPEAVAAGRTETMGWFSRLLASFGLLTVNHYQDLVEEINRVVERQGLMLKQLESRTETLWAVNQTWAWNDNAVLRFRKR